MKDLIRYSKFLGSYFKEKEFIISEPLFLSVKRGSEK